MYYTDGKPVPTNVQAIKNIVLSNVISINNNEILFNEIACFEKLMQNMLKRLPKDKFMENMLKMRRCIRRVVLISSTEWLETITHELNVLQSTSASPQQEVRNVLLHFKDYAHLLAQTVYYCEESFGILLQKLKVGHLLDSLVMSLGILSRTYVLFKSMAKKICHQYQQIIHMLPNEQEEESANLPINLSNWIEKEVYICLTQNRSPISQTKLNILDHMYESDNESNKIEQNVCYKYLENIIKSEDIGEPVSRSKTESLAMEKHKKNTKLSLKHRLKQFCHCPAKMNQLKKQFAKVRTLKALRNLFKKLHSQTLKYADISQPLSVHQLQQIKGIIKTTAMQIRKCKSKEDFNRQHVIDEAACEIFSIIVVGND